uniref:Uncharacterized protein n=1 Tax=Glossina palpalis gambiensis TaxID=67801 RepID=A0A1B0APY5_9MUSC
HKRNPKRLVDAFPNKQTLKFLYNCSSFVSVKVPFYLPYKLNRHDNLQQRLNNKNCSHYDLVSIMIITFMCWLTEMLIQHSISITINTCVVIIAGILNSNDCQRYCCCYPCNN